MTRRRQHPGEALALSMEPRERAQARDIHERQDRVHAVRYIRRLLECTIREAMDADDYLAHTEE